MEQWHGWLWYRGAWTRVCEGPTRAGCGRKLAALASSHRVPDRMTCLTTGGAPLFTPRADERGDRWGRNVCR
jgi:hypothetical protein